MPNNYDTSIIQYGIQAFRDREAKEEYLDGLTRHLSGMKVSGKPVDESILVSKDLQYGAELFGLQEFSPKVQSDILLSLAYFRSPAFQERVETSLGYAPGAEMIAQDAETYNAVVERAREAYSDISFEVTDNIRESQTMITIDGKTVVQIPDGNDQHELDSKLYSSLGVTTHEIAHYIYNSAATDAINPGVYHQGEGESLIPSKSYGKDNSPYNRINESNPGRDRVAEWYKQKDLERVRDLYEGGILSKYRYDEYVQRISGMSPEQLAEHENVDVKLKHDNTGFERAADVHAARMIMLQEGIWNPFSGEPLKREHVDEFQKRHPDSRIFEYWNSREATYFLNTIARNEGKQNPEFGPQKNLYEFIKNFDAEKFMGQLGQYASVMTGKDVQNSTSVEETRQAYTEVQDTVRANHLSAEKLKAMTAMNYECQMELNNSSEQPRQVTYRV